MTATGTTVLVDNNNSNSNGDDEDDEVAAAAAVSRSEATNSNSNIHNNEGSLVSLTRMDTSAYSATATARSSAPPVTLSQQHSPPAHDAPQSQASSSLQASSSIVRALFGPAVGPCYGDFFCTHHRIRGRLYATGLAVLYSSNLLGFERRICLRFCEIVELELHRTTSIRITMFDSESYVFRSFNDRVQVLHLLKALKAVSDRRLSGSGVARGFTGMPASVPLAPAASPSQLQRPRSEGHRLFESAAAATAATSVTATQPSFPRPTSRRSEPLVSNRRRAVSDSLLRSARLDAEDGGDDQEGSGLTASPLHASFDLGAGRSGYSENDARGMEDDMDDDDDDDDEESVHTPSPDDTTQTAWSKAKESAIATAGTVGIEVRTQFFYQRHSLLSARILSPLLELSLYRQSSHFPSPVARLARVFGDLLPAFLGRRCHTRVGLVPAPSRRRQRHTVDWVGFGGKHRRLILIHGRSCVDAVHDLYPSFEKECAWCWSV